MQIAEFRLRNHRDVANAAKRVRLLASLAGLPRRRRTSFGRAVKEISMSAIRHGGGGTVAFAIHQRSGCVLLEATICDRGPWMPPDENAEPIAAPAVPSAAGDSTDVPGELKCAGQLVDDWSIEREPTGGTLVRLLQQLPEDTELLLENDAAEWRAALAAGTTQGALVHSQRRVRDLTQRLLETQRRRLNLEQQMQEIKALNETLELLALVASKTENAVIILDALGRIDWVNDSFVRLTGRSLAAVRAQPLVQVWFPDTAAAPDATQKSTRDHQREVLQRALDQGRGISQEIQQRRADGQTYWASVNVTPVFDEQGRVTRWIGIANDITEWQLAQQALHRAKEAAEAASRAKGEFLANMSHEIRTPMNVIIGMTELTLGTPLTAEQHEYLNSLKNSADSLLRLLNDILDLSKIEAGKLQLETARFHLPTLLESLLAPLVLESRKKGLRLRWQIDPATGDWFLGDPVRLRQVLLNLVANAIKFTEVGRIDVFVEMLDRPTAEPELRFAVRDTGIGIAEDKLEHIFHSFTQADSSTTRRFGGTGLGLSISSQLVALMQGRMEVESRPAAGSTFRFAVPLPRAEPPPPEAVPHEAPASSGAARHLRVLVVDDNPANRLLAARILEKRGHTVLHASSGTEALEVIDRESLHLVLMDAQMPGMDGLEATAAVRARERESATHLPIVAITASAMQGDRERCLAAGMDAYIPKPIKSRDLARLVETLGMEHANSLPECPAAGAAVPRPFAAALARLEGDEEILREQMQMFLSDSPALLAQIRAAIQAASPDRLRLLAHRLKGFAASLDGEAVVEAARRLEEQGRTADLAAAETSCDRLARALTDLQTTIRCYTG